MIEKTEKNGKDKKEKEDVEIDWTALEEYWEEEYRKDYVRRYNV